MSNTPRTDQIDDGFYSAPDPNVKGYMFLYRDLCKDMEEAGNALYERLEHWIQMNSGICDPKDTAAIDAWKEATK